jgi:hypothetical protein
VKHSKHSTNAKQLHLAKKHGKNVFKWCEGKFPIKWEEFSNLENEKSSCGKIFGSGKKWKWENLVTKEFEFQKQNW